jgi:hypothetical protein
MSYTAAKLQLKASAEGSSHPAIVIDCLLYVPTKAKLHKKRNEL